MIREVIASKCGIQFDPVAMQNANVDIGTLEEIVEGIESGIGRCANDKEADKRDVMQPIHDELKSNVMWWGLELMPLIFSWQDKKGNWVWSWRCVKDFFLFHGCLTQSADRYKFLQVSSRTRPLCPAIRRTSIPRVCQIAHGESRLEI
jgi:hypothetical protein